MGAKFRKKATHLLDHLIVAVNNREHSAISAESDAKLDSGGNGKLLSTLSTCFM